MVIFLYIKFSVDYFLFIQDDSTNRKDKAT